MDIYVLGREIITLFVSSSINLIIHFSDPMVAAGGNSNIQITELNQSKSFIINASDKDFETNLVFFNDNDQYNIILKSSDNYAHDFVNIFNGERSNSFTVRHETPEFRVLESEKSTLVESLIEDPLLVNGKRVNDRVQISKGAPIFIEATDKKFLLNYGRKL